MNLARVENEAVFFAAVADGLRAVCEFFLAKVWLCRIRSIWLLTTGKSVDSAPSWRGGVAVWCVSIAGYCIGRIPMLSLHHPSAAVRGRLCREGGDKRGQPAMRPGGKIFLGRYVPKYQNTFQL